MERPSRVGPKPEGEYGIRGQMKRRVDVPGTGKKKTVPLGAIIAVVIVLILIIVALVIFIPRGNNVNNGNGNNGNGNNTAALQQACASLGSTWDVVTAECVPATTPVPEPAPPVVETFTYGAWHPWTECSTREGEGVQKRIRYCESGNCPAEYELETQPCQQGQTCSHSWTSGTYSGSCSNCDWLRYFYGEGLTGWFWYCRDDKDAVAAEKGYGEFN